MENEKPVHPEDDSALKVRWRSGETSIPAARPILSHATGEPYFHSENWEHGPEKPEWINTTTFSIRRLLSPGLNKPVPWKEEGLRLFQQRGKHTDCSRDVKGIPVIMATPMKAKEGRLRWAGAAGTACSMEGSRVALTSTLSCRERGALEEEASPLGGPAGCSSLSFPHSSLKSAYAPHPVPGGWKWFHCGCTNSHYVPQSERNVCCFIKLLTVIVKPKT